MDLLSRLVVSSIALAGELAGCTPTPTPSPAAAAAPAPAGPDFGVQLCKQQHPPVLGDCTALDCGGNSSVVNGFPVNGFSKDATGACNVAGVQLIPRSLEGGHCGRGSDLGLDEAGTRLVGRRQGQVVCTGDELTGASFLVRSFAATQAFTITNVRPIKMLDGNPYEGYRIESGGGSACEPATALRIKRQLGLIAENAAPLPALPRPAGYQFGPHDDLVIVVDGPLFDSRDRVMTGSRDHWFNLACAGDALAKRTLYNLYTASDDARNETALRMLTANYCGKPYTVPGVELEWEKSGTSDMTVRHEEALWKAGKAICIGTPRLTTLHMVDGGEPISPAGFPAQLQPKGCEDHHCDAVQWASTLRAECQLRDCKDLPRVRPPYEFDSWDFDSDQNHILLATP